MSRSFTLLLVILVFSFSASQALAQCVPDSMFQGDYSPDENEGLPSGHITIPYSATINIRVPSDTTVEGFSASVDKLVLENVIGLPPTFEYECGPDSCTFQGGSYGCVRVFGLTEDNADAGTWDLTAEFKLHLSGITSFIWDYTLEDYSIHLDSVAVGVAEIDPEVLKFNIEPNPISERSKLVFDLPSNGRYSLNIYSLLGSNVASIESVAKSGTHYFSLSDFSKDAGVYFVSLKQGTYARSMRFIVQ